MGPLNLFTAGFDTLPAIFKASGIVVLAALVTATVAFLVDYAFLLGAYEKRFAFRPAGWFAERLATTEDPEKSCLIMGASTARQGFDPLVLERSRQ